MDAKEFIDLLDSPEKVEDYSVEELKELSLKYPYSQPLQLLYAVRLRSSSEYLFNRQLGRTSILTDDRSVLFDLFERPSDMVAEYAAPAEADLETVPEEPVEIENEAAQALPEKEDIEEERDFRQLQVVGSEGEEEPLDEASAEDTADEKQADGKPVHEGPAIAKAEETDQPISARERIKAILDENRRLRGEFESARKEEKKELSGIEQRLEEIKKKLEANRRPAEKEDGPQTAPAKTEPEETGTAVDDLQRKVEQEIEELKEEVQAVPEATVPEMMEEDISAEEPGAGEIADEAEEPAEEQKSTADQKEMAGARENISPAEDLEAEKQPRESEEAETEKEVEKGHEPEKHNFSEWLKLLKKEPIEKSGEAPEQKHSESSAEKYPEPAEEETAGFEKKIELLDTFVEKLPELKKKKPVLPRTEKFPPALHNVHGSSDDSLVTETLARVYIEQKHYDKAIKAYEIMKLKYPEKSGLFAARISEIKKLINSK